jgi:uncharacterized membrane protein YphA (DoxX/SURF4 family)
MDHQLAARAGALRIIFGVTATLAGLDKFFNLLADWSSYVSPFAAQLLPVSADVFMYAVGVIELAVGIAILGAAPVLGAYVASAWLLVVAVNLLVAGFIDVAVRDVVMSVAAFTLARLLELRAEAPAARPVADGRRQPAAAYTE